MRIRLGLALFEQCIIVLVLQRGDRRLLANPAFANELAARFDHELLAMHLAEDFAAGDDFEPGAFDLAVQIAADDDVVRRDVPFETAGAADGNVGGGIDAAFDRAVDVQGALQVQFSAELASRCDNRRPTRLYLSFVAFTKESHFTRPSFSNNVSY